MFSIRLLSKHLRILQTSRGSRSLTTNFQICSKFTGRDIYDHSHGETGTLSQRFIKYIAIESCKYDPLIPQKIKYSQYFPLHNFREFRQLLIQTNIEQFPRLLVYTSTYKTNGDPHKTAEIINEIDAICCTKLKTINYDEILRILYSFMYLIPNKITYLDFYWTGLQHIINNYNHENSKMLKEQFVQICYYIGLSKKSTHRNTEYMNKFIENILPEYLDELNRTDFAIISNAIFKISMIIKNPQYQERLIDEILQIDLTDDAILVTLLKSLRLQKIKSDKIYKKLTDGLMKLPNLKQFHFKGLVHILASFAEGNWNEPIICTKLINECKQRLEDTTSNNSANYRDHEEQPFNDIRAKDISTFIWSIGHLCLPTNLLTADDFKYIEEIILNKFEHNEYRKYPDDFIDTCLSLWILNHKSQNLINYAMEIHSNQQQHNKVPASERIKLESRITLLFNCVQLEKPNWLNRKIPKNNPTIFNETRTAPEYLIKNRTNLKIISQILKDNQDALTIRTHKLVSPIQELNIAGVFVELEDNRKCYVEVLETNQIMKFNQVPTSMVTLKTRLLENLGYHVIVVDSTECLLAVDKLKELLKSKIDAVPISLDVAKLAV